MLSFQFNPFPVLETDRLILRAIHDSDDEDLFFLRSHEEVNRYLEDYRHVDIKQSQELIVKLKKGVDENELIFWAIALKGSGNLIGNICLWKLDKEKHYAELGYVLHPHYFGKGIMQEASKKVIEYGFETMHLRTIGAYTHAQNKKSIQLLVKSNFQHTGNKKENNRVIYTLINSKKITDGKNFH